MWGPSSGDVAWIELLGCYPMVRGSSLVGIMEDEACGVNEPEGGVLGSSSETGAVALVEFLDCEIGGATPLDQNSGRDLRRTGSRRPQPPPLRA
jgi:hypothetical protein